MFKDGEYLKVLWPDKYFGNLKKEESTGCLMIPVS
jgi:hypothetical protein